MSTQNSDKAACPVAPTIARWLARGWTDFRCMPGLSMGFGAVFLLVELLLLALLLSLGLPLVAFPFLAGFVLLAPFFALGYYESLRVREAGGRPGGGDLLRGFTRAGAGVWAIGFLLVFCYFVWITDALLIYALYFGGGGAPGSPVLGVESLAGPAGGFLFFAGLTGFLLALGIFVVVVFSIPLVFERRCGFVSAILQSLRLVAARPRLLLSWGLLLAVGMFVALFLLPPLLPLMFPVLAYAGYRAYQDLLPV